MLPPSGGSSLPIPSPVFLGASTEHLKLSRQGPSEHLTPLLKLNTAWFWIYSQLLGKVSAASPWTTHGPAFISFSPLSDKLHVKLLKKIQLNLSFELPFS